MYCTFEVEFDLPIDPAKEREVCEIAARFGGKLDQRTEQNWPGVAMYVSLLFVCDDELRWKSAQEAIHAAGYDVIPGVRLRDDDWD